MERVQENAADFKVPLKKYEVMVHGVLHYADTRTREKQELLMRSKEDENWRCSTWNSKSYLVLSAAMFHVERLLRML
jgi:hypothetical protein